MPSTLGGVALGATPLKVPERASLVSTPPSVRTGYYSCHHAFDGCADLLCRIQDVLVIQMRVARRGLVVPMPEQSPNHRQRLLVHGGMAGERMPKIVEAHIGEARSITKVMLVMCDA